MSILHSRLIALQFLLLAIDPSFASEVQEGIYGRWYTVGKEDAAAITFSKDGFFEIVGEVTQGEHTEDVPFTGTFSFVDENHIQLNMGGFIGALAGPKVVEFTLDRDRLTIVEDGDPVTYTRRKEDKIPSTHLSKLCYFVKEVEKGVRKCFVSDGPCNHQNERKEVPCD